MALAPRRKGPIVVISPAKAETVGTVSRRRAITARFAAHIFD